MATLDSGLKTIDQDLQGWHAIFDFDTELLDQKLVSVMTAIKEFGEATLADNTSSASDPNAQSSTAVTMQTISGTGDDVNINANFSDLATSLNAIVAEIADLIPKLTAAIDYIDTVKTSNNALLVELRKSTGSGVLGG